MNTQQTVEHALPEKLQRRKDQADVAKAEADTRTAEATARKTEVEADKEAAAALRDQVTALIPDLTKVKDSTVEVKDGTPMWGTFLTFEALPKVAERIATLLDETEDGRIGSGRFLVTSDPDLATRDAIYEDVRSGLEELRDAADRLLQEDFTAELEPLTVGLAFAAALPGLLSLLSVQTTVTTGATLANDLAAVAAVTRALRTKAPTLSIVYDDFRLIPIGEIHTRLSEVADRRLQLIAKKLTLADEKSKTDAALAEAKAATPQDPKTIADLERRSTDAATRLGLIDSTIVAIDTVLAGIRSVPAGAKRSLLATAALHEALHSSEGFTHVLLVKAQAGQARETVDNRPFMFEDKYFAIADASVTYILIKTENSKIVESGNVTRVASARGALNSKPTVDVSDAPV